MRFTLTLDQETRDALRARARAHKTTQAGFLRAAINGCRPGGGRGDTAASADAWWDSLPASRRAGIHAWVAQRRSGDDHMPGQLEIGTQEAL